MKREEKGWCWIRTHFTGRVDEENQRGRSVNGVPNFGGLPVREGDRGTKSRTHPNSSSPRNDIGVTKVKLN